MGDLEGEQKAGRRCSEHSGLAIVPRLSQVNEQADQKYHDCRVNNRQQNILFRIGDKDKKEEASASQQEHEVLQNHQAKDLDIGAARQSAGDQIPKYLSDFVHPFLDLGSQV